MTENAKLLAAIRERAFDPASATDCGDTSPVSAAKPATAKQIAAAEETLGVKLPPFLLQLYTEIGNGGFGPDYGLLGIGGGARDDQKQDALKFYQSQCKPDDEDPLWNWPRQLLPVIHSGCGMYLCVDCSTATGEVTWFEPNPHDDGEPWDESFIPLNKTLQQIFTDWIEGKSWIEGSDSA